MCSSDLAGRRAGPHGDDTTSLLLRFESGLTGLAFCSVAATRNYRFAVYGSEAFGEVLTPSMDTLRFIPAVQGRASHVAKIPEPETIVTAGFSTVEAELLEFARCVDERRPYPVPPEDVLHGVCVFEAAVASARTGLPVAVDG